MSTVKISQLYEITHLNTDTSQTLLVGVDLPSGITGKITATTLAEGLYSNNPLKVGSNSILFPYTVGQFSGTSPLYLQVNLQNFNPTGTSDHVMTADTGTDTTSYIDMGITNSEYANTSPQNGLGTCIEPLSGYLYVQGNTSGGNLIIGTSYVGTKIKLIAGGINQQNVIAYVSQDGIELINNKILKFTDGTYQSTAAAPNNYSVSSYNFANTVNSYAYSANSWLQANDASTLSVSKSYTDSTNTFLRANDSVTLTSAKTYTDTANTFLQSNTGSALAVAKAYTDTANNYLQSNTGSALAVSKAYTDTANSFLRANDTTTLTSSKAYTDVANTFIQANYVANTTSIVTNKDLTVSGALYSANTMRTPNVFPGSQTAINVYFANSSQLIKCTTATGLTVSLNSFVSGKFIDLIIVNSSGSTSTITHGCSALNSTKGAVSFNMAGSSTAYLRYMCVGTDINNTFVSIVNA